MAKKSWMSSGALPNVTFSSPPIPGPVLAAIASVASPISAAHGITPSAAAAKTRTGEACASSRPTATGMKIPRKWIGRTTARTLWCGRARPPGGRLLLVGVGLEVDFVRGVLGGGLRALAAVAAVVVRLEALQQLVTPGLVDRALVGYQHPVGALELLEVEDLLVHRARVVDHHQH